MTARWAVAAVCAAACGDAPGEPRARSTEIAAEIAGGAIDPGDPAVVALVEGGAVICTGVVIAPRAVLTAAHCGDAGAPREIFLGADPARDGARIAIAALVRDPAYVPGAAAGDVAVALLAAPTDVAPVALAAPAALAVGAAVRLVGFGQPAQVKTLATARVSELDASTFAVVETTGLPCPGDSGGPALLVVDGVEQVAGVVSRGDPACRRGATYARVGGDDLAARLIAATRDGALGAGERCYFDESCRAGRCVAPADAPHIRTCAPPCAVDADCPRAMACVVDAGARVCRHRAPSPGALGAACGSALDCEEALCAAGLDGAPVCTRPCFPDQPATCPEAMACVAGPDPARGACFARSPDGGCAAAPGSGWLAIALAAWLGRGRRGARSRRLAPARRAGVSSCPPSRELRCPRCER